MTLAAVKLNHNYQDYARALFDFNRMSFRNSIQGYHVMRMVAYLAAAAPATKTGAAPVSAQRPAASQRPAPAPVASAIKPLDTILIYAAAVAGLVAVGGVVWVFLTLKGVVENFTS